MCILKSLTKYKLNKNKQQLKTAHTSSSQPEVATTESEEISEEQRVEATENRQPKLQESSTFQSDQDLVEDSKLPNVEDDAPKSPSEVHGFVENAECDHTEKATSFDEPSKMTKPVEQAEEILQRTSTSSALKAENDISGLIGNSTSVPSCEPAETATDCTKDEEIARNNQAAPMPSSRRLTREEEIDCTEDEETDFMESEDEEWVFKKIVIFDLTPPEERSYIPITGTTGGILKITTRIPRYNGSITVKCDTEKLHDVYLNARSLGSKIPRLNAFKEVLN